MKAIYSFPSQPLKKPKFLLVGITAGLIAIHLTITWKRDYTDLWGMSLLFWVTVCCLIWKKRTTLILKSSAMSSLLGALLITLVVLESAYPINKFPYISLLLSATGLGLIASGFKGLKQYWQELLILFLPCAAYIALYLIDISILTAKFATLVLWYFGFQVSRQGVNIILPLGVAEVNKACSGLENIFHLWALSILFSVILRTSSYKIILLPVIASFIGFVVNGFRVALMTILIEFNDQKAFEYWHTGDGSLIFSIICILIFGLFCLFLLRIDESEKQSSVKS